MKDDKFSNIWTIPYRKGPAPMVGQFAACDEGEALRVAQAWAATQEGVRILGAQPKPFILADASILSRPIPQPEPEPIPSPVEATTVVNSGKGR